MSLVTSSSQLETPSHAPAPPGAPQHVAAPSDEPLASAYDFSMGDDATEEQDDVANRPSDLPLDILINEIGPGLADFFNERSNIFDYLLANDDFAKNNTMPAAATTPAHASPKPHHHPPADPAAQPAAGAPPSSSSAPVAAHPAPMLVSDDPPPAVAPTANALPHPVNPAAAAQARAQPLAHAPHAPAPPNAPYAHTYVQPPVVDHNMPQRAAASQVQAPPVPNVQLNALATYPQHPHPAQNLSPSASVSTFNLPSDAPAKPGRQRPCSPRKHRSSSPNSNQGSRNSSSRNHSHGSSSRKASPQNRARRGRVGEKRNKPGKDSSLVATAAANRVKKEAVPHPVASSSNPGHPSAHVNVPFAAPAVDPAGQVASIALPPGVKPDSVGAAAAVAAMAAVQSATGGMSELKMETASETNSQEKVEGEGDPKKQMRAERNRQSAAASRERKKEHIKELERRVTLLSEHNAKLQVSQLEQIRDRLAEEARLLSENGNLRRTVVFKEMEISKLTHKLKSHKIADDDDENSLRRHTWDHSVWKKRCG